ncbi:MAG TPA: hypothetical protein VNT03_05970, partial [Baekduia sp.]|nr:hypothetical protein [Baekduia sp.]
PDRPPAVTQRPPRWPDAPPLPLGPVVAPGPDRGGPSATGAVPSVRALFATPVGGADTLARGISDGALLENASGAVRRRAGAAARALGASVVRLPVSWSNTLPGAPPVDASDPGDPAYDFSVRDAAVRDAVAAGLTPLLVVSHAPPYAEAPGRWRYAAAGAWAPSPGELAAFGAALARRYSGSWPDPAWPGRTLPRVVAFQAWNEPNLPRYLAPQWTVRGGRWVPWAPAHYRRMVNAFAGAVRAVQPDATIVSAGLAPNGEGVDGAGRMTPVRFLRALLCLAPPAGRPIACGGEKTDFDVMAFHPLSVGAPDAAARSALDVSVADVGKVRALLRIAERRGRLARHAPALWVTELNWTTGAISRNRRAAAVGRGLHRLWAAGTRVVVWHFLEDPSGLPDRQAGLRTRGLGGPLTGHAKAYARGFALPVDVAYRGRGSGRADVWTLPLAGGTLRVQWQRRGAARRWKTVERVAGVRSDRPLQVTVRTHAGARVRVISGGRASAAIVVR